MTAFFPGGLLICLWGAQLRDPELRLLHFIVFTLFSESPFAILLQVTFPAPSSQLFPLPASTNRLGFAASTRWRKTGLANSPGSASVLREVGKEEGQGEGRPGGEMDRDSATTVHPITSRTAVFAAQGLSPHNHTYTRKATSEQLMKEQHAECWEQERTPQHNL